MFGLNYEFALSDEEERLLQMEKVEDIAVLVGLEADVTLKSKNPAA